MLTVLSALTFDPLGVVELDVLSDSNFGNPRRRMNRVGTLDGGAVFNDFGYTESDRTISLVWTVTDPEIEAAVARLVQLYARVLASTPAGLFLVALEAYTAGAAESRLTLLVVTKLA